MIDNKKILLLTGIFLFLFSYIIFVGLYHRSDVFGTLYLFLGDTKSAPHLEHFFGFFPFFGIPVILHLYIASFLIFILCAVVFRKKIIYHHNLLWITLSLWAFITVWQNIKYFETCRVNNEYFKLKRNEDKYSFLNKKPFIFSQKIISISDKPYNCQFITDVDTDTDPGMYRKRALAYFLYPFYDILGIRSKDTDCIIFFQKKEASNYIPAGYKVLLELNANDIVTVKNN